MLQPWLQVDMIEIEITETSAGTHMLQSG